MGTAFINSGWGEKIVEKYGEDYGAGVSVSLIMAIAWVETEYATELTTDESTKHNAFGATDGGKATDPLIEYKTGWREGVEDQGRYIIDNYFTSDEERSNGEDPIHFIARIRGEEEGWANRVIAEKTQIE